MRGDEAMGNPSKCFSRSIANGELENANRENTNSDNVFCAFIKIITWFTGKTLLRRQLS
jgi:hypothetical protein